MSFYPSDLQDDSFCSVLWFLKMSDHMINAFEEL